MSYEPVKISEDHGYFLCKKDWLNDHGYKCFTKGKKYPIQTIGVCDQTIEYCVLSDDHIITTFIDWYEEIDEREEYFDICEPNSPNIKDEMIFVPKTWGFEKWIWNSDKYCGKLLYFVQNKWCSYHYHKIKDEVFYIQSGRIKVIYGDTDDIKKTKSVILEKGDRFHVPIGLRHQMIAEKDTELFEFSTTHIDEDSYRVTRERLG